MTELDPARLAVVIGSVLFAHGETTEAVRCTVADLGRAAGTRFDLVAQWDELEVLSPGVPTGARVQTIPLGIDIMQVVAAHRLAAEVCGGFEATAARARLERIAAEPPVGLPRFAIMAAAGAVALAVIFGATDGATLVAIGISAGLGAGLRRGLAWLSSNPFLQPLATAFLAGALASMATRLGLTASGQLLALCPCMVLVPGPHVLNGAIDLVRARLPLGMARLGYAGLIILAICTGLLTGLASGDVGLIPLVPTPPVPFARDMAAAGVAVAAYGAFFNMPWRMLPVPVLAGMAGHAVRWLLISSGSGAPAGALAACLMVGCIVAPVAHCRRTPFGATAFASVVSMLPGILLFQAAAQATALVLGHAADPMADLLGAVENSTTACLVVGAMTIGLIVPKLILDECLAAATRR